MPPLRDVTPTGPGKNHARADVAQHQSPVAGLHLGRYDHAAVGFDDPDLEQEGVGHLL